MTGVPTNVRGRVSANSLSALLCTLAPSLVLNSVIFVIFLLVRKKFRRIYQPRTFVGSIPAAGRVQTRQTLLGWAAFLLREPDRSLLRTRSIDAYLFLRYLKILIAIAVIGCCLTWPILLPVNATGGRPVSQFDTLAITNVADPNRLYVHNFVAWVYFGFIMFMVKREIHFCVQLRHEHLSSPHVSSLISTRTVLFLEVPRSHRSVKAMNEIFNGEVIHVWAGTNTHRLERAVGNLNIAVDALELAELPLLRAAHRRWCANNERADAIRWAQENARPKERRAPFSADKVDAIERYRYRVRALADKVKRLQYRYGSERPAFASVFVEFESIEAADRASKAEVSGHPGVFQFQEMGLRPKDVLWANTGLSRRRRATLRVTSLCLAVALAFVWAPVSGFIGLLSNVEYLEKVTWLAWLRRMPPQLLGVITGLLPSTLMTLIVSLVPFLFQVLTRHGGCLSLGEAELRVQNWYFAFQVVQLFLLVTIGSSAAVLVGEISTDPRSISTTLAMSLPKASNFYISYIVLYGVATSAATLMNYVTAFLYVVGSARDKSPRRRFNRAMNICIIHWGVCNSRISALAVMFITYSILAPIILGFAAAALVLIHAAFRYNIFFALDTGRAATTGRYYARAMEQLFAGIYLGEVCLIGLFTIGAIDRPSAAGAAILMLIFLGGTVLYHLHLRKTLTPLMTSVPQMPGLMDSDIHDRRRPRGLWWRLCRPHCDLAEFRQEPAKYSKELRHKAYLHPAVSFSQPVVWLVDDHVGLTLEEMRLVGPGAHTSMDGAWWDKFGRLCTWAGDYRGGQERITDVPIYEEETCL